MFDFDFPVEEFSTEDLPRLDLAVEYSPVVDLSGEDLPVSDLVGEDLPETDLSGDDSLGVDFSGDDSSILDDWSNFVSSGGQDSFLSSFGSGSELQLVFPDSIHLEIEEEEQPLLSDGVAVPFASVDPITPANTNGLKSILLSVLGDYESIVVEYRYQNTGSSTYQYLRQVTPDYPWLMSAALFIVLIISLFRIAGGFLWKR